MNEVLRLLRAEQSPVPERYQSKSLFRKRIQLRVRSIPIFPSKCFRGFRYCQVRADFSEVFSKVRVRSL